MISRLPVSALLLALLTLGSAASAADLEIGKSYRRVIEAFGKQMPLPEGEWRLAGLGYAVMPPVGAAAPSRVLGQAILFRAGEGRLDAFLELTMNAVGSPDGWGLPSECLRTDLYITITPYKSGWDGSCRFITFATTAAAEVTERPKAWTEALRMAGRDGLRLPTSWLQVGFRAANRRDVIDARFHFDVAGFGLPPADSSAWSDDAWNPRRVADDPQRLTVVRQLSDWADGFESFVDLGLKNRIDTDTVAPSPNAERRAEGPPADDSRLKLLQRLRDEGRLSERDFEVQRDLLAKTAAAEALGDALAKPDGSTVAFYKTLTYRPLASLTTTMVDLFWIGQPFTAGVLAFLQVSAAGAKSYFNELIWDRYFASGRDRADLPRTVDFPQAARMM